MEKISGFVSFLNTKLWSSKFIELDVCGRPLFTNPVTFMYGGTFQKIKRRAIQLCESIIIVSQSAQTPNFLYYSYRSNKIVM